MLLPRRACGSWWFPTILFRDLQSAADARGLRLAAESFLAAPLGAPLIPNWNRVVAAMPDIFARLHEAVEIDNA